MSEELVTIGSYEFVVEAEIAQLFLRENGVEATLREDGVVGMNWMLGNAVGYVKVQVPEGQVRLARELMSQLPGRNGGSAAVCRSCGLALGDEQEVCPACGAAVDEDPHEAADVARYADRSSGDAANDEEASGGVGRRVRSWKKPVLWLLLTPTLLWLAVLVLGLVVALLQKLGL